MDNQKRNLAGLALRAYCKNGYWHNLVVTYLMTGQDFTHILKFDLGKNESVKGDIPLLKNLIADFNGHYVDLFTSSELLEQHVFLPQSESELRQVKIDGFLQEKLGIELYDLLTGIIEDRYSIPESMPVDLQEVCELARLKYRLYHSEEPVIDSLPTFEEPLDLGIDDGQAMSDIEPLPIAQDNTQIPSPLNEVKTLSPRKVEIGLQHRRSWEGKL